MVPTKRLWALAALGILIAALAGLVEQPLIALAYNGFLLALAVITYRLGPDGKDLKVARRFDPVLSVRVPNWVRLELVNEGSDTLVGRLRDEPPPLFRASQNEMPLNLTPGQELETRYEVTPPFRGTDYFRGTYLRLKCPLGLVERDVKLTTEQPVRVYPNVLAMREFDLLKQRGKLRDLGIRISRMRGLGSEFESLRDYALGDDFRKIDWKATARRNKLIVRQYEQERSQPVVVCIDVGRRMLAEADGIPKLDHALDALLMLLHAAQVGGDQIGLLVYSDRVIRFIPPRKGRNQMGVILEAIHDLTAEPVESDPVGAFAYFTGRWKRRSLVVTFTDMENDDEARLLATALAPLRFRHVHCAARVADPKLKELTETPLTNVDSMYKQAAALHFVDERKRAGSVLDGYGVHHLEAEPQDLAASLVSFYFFVKERSLI